MQKIVIKKLTSLLSLLTLINPCKVLLDQIWGIFRIFRILKVGIKNFWILNYKLNIVKGKRKELYIYYSNVRLLKHEKSILITTNEIISCEAW